MKPDVISIKNLNYYSDDLTILFNRKKFFLEDLVNLEKTAEFKEEFIEVLPGIYTKIIQDNKLKRWLKKFNKLDHLISFELWNKNMRDKIAVRYDDAYTNFLYVNHEFRRDRLVGTVGSTRATYVDVSQIKNYPYLLTGDARKCAVWRWFEKQNLIDTWGDYSPFTVQEMLTLSSERQEFLEICRRSEHCGSLLRKFETDTYREDVPDYDQIQLANCNGELVAEEGKHRTCIVKRFKIPSVYALVYDVSEKETGKLEDPFSFAWRAHKETSQIIKGYYKSFQEAGLNKDQITFVLENGLRGSELFEYIQHCTRKKISS
ncbi:hypothetical protein NLX71_25215 [Paenibacillus sp. MZ04-78.2]|uniref:hypothetical protein n=1 Tax=Paenibacillus sp. MZ04-78.2 TaxID=2962034 RepID=UPI0020B73E30|nr:hypothetical protein [Paenibacillus sp. MZ04-78.2]MCP3776549.1 hypothetical protein [Paenibacillus sp. MZ04-78.2]